MIGKVAERYGGGHMQALQRIRLWLYEMLFPIKAPSHWAGHRLSGKPPPPPTH
ncbi:MAG: hypothetical protein AAFY51_01110 [Pseudomonadota bacterium]